jgi:hypothetical protein
VACTPCPPGEDQEKGEVVGPYVPFFSNVVSARYSGDSIFSTEMVNNRSPRSSCNAPASSSATSTSSILYVPALTPALFTVMSRSAPASIG